LFYEIASRIEMFFIVKLGNILLESIYNKLDKNIKIVSFYYYKTFFLFENNS
jgi:hypothetical protein